MTSCEKHAVWRVTDEPAAADDPRDGTVAAEIRAHAEPAAAMDRVPGWFFRSLGALTALVASWFAMAFLGGLPAGPVEWLTLAILGAFAYSVGVTVPLMVSFFANRPGRR